MGYSLEVSAFEPPAIEGIKSNLRGKLGSMNKFNRVEFVMDLVQKLNPDLTANELEELIESSSLQVI